MAHLAFYILLLLGIYIALKLVMIITQYDNCDTDQITSVLWSNAVIWSGIAMWAGWINPMLVAS